jgi:hypothetical protein
VKIQKVLEELPMAGVGAGLAVAGISTVSIGFQAMRQTKNFYAAGVMMTFGALFAQVGSQIAIGSVERMMGKR